MHLVLAGAAVDAPYAEELRGRAAAAGNVHVIGGVPPHVARGLLAEATLALVPSRAEPFGIVLLEAWAEGTPALAADVGGLRDIAHTTGAPEILVAGGVDAWAPQIQAWLDPARLANERRVVQARVSRHYSWGALAERTASAYASAQETMS
jgi:D-inositol-3-phosphate glycosyltransferase